MWINMSLNWSAGGWWSEFTTIRKVEEHLNFFFFWQNSCHSPDYTTLWLYDKHNLAKVLPDLAGNEVLQLTFRLHWLNPNWCIMDIPLEWKLTHEWFRSSNISISNVNCSCLLANLTSWWTEGYLALSQWTHLCGCTVSSSLLLLPSPCVWTLPTLKTCLKTHPP